MANMLSKAAYKIYMQLGKWYLSPLLKAEWRRAAGPVNERPVEYSFALRCLGNICPEEILDVGAGTGPWPETMAKCGFHVTAIDEIKGYWQGKFFNRHHYVIHDDITDPRLNKQFDLITCISVIEHIPDHRAAMKGLFRLLKPEGHLILTFPYCENRYVENVYALEGSGYGQKASYICQVFSRNEIDQWLEECNGAIIEQEYYKIFSGDLWTFGERVKPLQKVGKDDKHHLTCLLIQKK